MFTHVIYLQGAGGFNIYGSSKRLQFRWVLRGASHGVVGARSHEVLLKPSKAIYVAKRYDLNVDTQSRVGQAL